MYKYCILLVALLIVNSCAEKNTVNMELDELKRRVYSRNDPCAQIAFEEIRVAVELTEDDPGQEVVDNLKTIYNDNEIEYIQLLGSRDVLLQKLNHLKKYGNTPGTAVKKQLEPLIIEASVNLSFCKIEKAAKYINSIEKLLNMK